MSGDYKQLENGVLRAVLEKRSRVHPLGTVNVLSKFHFLSEGMVMAATKLKELEERS